jgi:hypothetical protein
MSAGITFAEGTPKVPGLVIDEKIRGARLS